MQIQLPTRQQQWQWQWQLQHDNDNDNDNEYENENENENDNVKCTQSLKIVAVGFIFGSQAACYFLYLSYLPNNALLCLSQLWSIPASSAAFHQLFRVAANS